jgi:hypothetical protein
VVEGVGDVEVPLGVEGQARRPAQLPLAGARLAPLLEELAVPVQDRHPVQRVVRDDEVAVAVGDDRGR